MFALIMHFVQSPGDKRFVGSLLPPPVLFFVDDGVICLQHNVKKLIYNMSVCETREGKHLYFKAKSGETSRL